MNNQTILFNLKSQPVRKKIIKALWFHGISLVLVFIGLFMHYIFSFDRNTIITINSMYILFLYFLPLIHTIAFEGATIGRTALNDILSRYHFTPSLKDFLVIRTLGSLCRDSSIVHMIVIMSISINLSLLGFTLNVSPQFPLLLMAFFYACMITRYIIILKKLNNSSIVINEKGISLPFFSIIKKHIFFIEWSHITYLEVIGSEEKLLQAAYNMSSKNIPFVL
jgi:hypothetical protein